MYKLRLKYEFIERVFRKCPFCEAIPNVFQIPYEDKIRKETEMRWVVECKNMGCIFGRSKPYYDLEKLAEDWDGFNTI